MEIPAYIATQFQKPDGEPAVPNLATPIAAGLDKLAGALADADIAFRQQASDIERAQALSAIDLNVRSQMKDLELGLQKDPDWQTYDQRWGEGFRKIKADALGSIKDPVLLKGATLHVGNLESDGSMRAMATSRKMAGDSFEAFRLRSKNSTLAALAKVDNPEDEAAIAGMHLGVINAQEQGGWLAPDAAEKERIDFAGHFLNGRANRDIDRDPDVFARDLLSGKYAALPIDQQNRLDEKYVRVKEKQEKEQQQLGEAEEKRRDGEILSRALFGELTREELDRRFRSRLVSPGGYETASRVVSKAWDEGGVSDPRTRDDLLIRMYVSPFSVSPANIASARANGQLSGKDAASATKTLLELQETRGGIKDPRYNDGISKITKSISRGPMEVLSAPAARTLVLDMIEFEDRVLGKKEDPKVVSDEIALRNEQNQSGLMKSPIIPYSNVNELNAAYRRKQVSPRMYEAYLRTLNKTSKPSAPAGKKSSMGE
ncbi:MAG: hypothetical protein M0Z38_07050 [Deltaproteobacteria bacterium]|nr:hypothetical protein [Deltaproteobacteria bacterium]